MYVERSIKKKFEKIMPLYPIIALVGPRQAGKTTFLKERLKNRDANYLLFDDPDIRQIFDEDVKKFELQFFQGKEFAVLDEVQCAREPGQKLKYLADSGKKIWVTASSEILLSQHVLSYLVGRVSILRLYPFNVEEFLAFKEVRIEHAKLVERETEEHILFGGYPKVVLTPDIDLKRTILRDLYETMILKDIARTFSIQDITALERFASYLSINTGTQLSYDAITQTMGMSFQTTKKYLDAMEKSYFIIRVKPYFTNKTKELTKQPKIYALDTGLRNSIAKAFTLDGKMFENYIAVELVKAGFMPKYWRTKTKQEVDFIIEAEDELIPIEVKLSEERIPRSMHIFIERYKPKRAYIVTFKENCKSMKQNGCTIIFTTVTKLLNELKHKN